MLSLGSIDENLHFLILEVTRQVERTRGYLRYPTAKTLEVIRNGDDYIDHLRTIIQRKCFSLARDVDQNDRFEIELLKSLDLITGNLERIADFCESVVGQFGYLVERELVDDIAVEQNFDQIVSGLEEIESALQERDVQKALDLCRIESELDELHATTFSSVLRRLEQGGDPQTCVTMLFISHYFERMGDAMLNIGEAILSAALGERIKVDQYRALQDSVSESGAFESSRSLDRFSLEALGETRSGCRIDRVEDRRGDDERMVVFKEGRTDKLVEEKLCVERWNEILPGFVPQIYSFQEREQSSAILFEYLPGRTVEELVLRSHADELNQALDVLESALVEIWTKTRCEESVRPAFIHQLSERLTRVYELHPDFRLGAASFGDVEIETFDRLVARGERLDDLLVAPFSVLGHGDLNVDNVIFDRMGGRIRLIDLHRSGQTDFVQDVSVLLVSFFRLQVFDQPVRQRIDDAISRLHEFAGDFADRSDDRSFGARLAAGLARSFVTSTRFVLDEEFAESLFFRGRYLLEQLLALSSDEVLDYRVPPEILID